MNDEARRIQIRWRRILFGFHLLVWLIARLAAGSINQMPPAAIYDGLGIWGLVVLAHGALLALLDGRDRADLPLRQLNRLVEPRERRWSLLIIDAAAWVMLTTAIASRLIPEYLITHYAAPLSLLWLALTALGIAHLLLVLYAEVRDRAGRKRKNSDLTSSSETPLLISDDGELIAFPNESRQKINRD